MTDKKQSSIEWFWNEVGNILPFSVDSATAIKLYDALQQAKAMHKEEIVHSHLLGLIHPLEKEATKQAEDYYSETFNV